jgi:tRNA-Thr(GGU) m(6)t(6)A37 methyltransferase TsaA
MFIWGELMVDEQEIICHPIGQVTKGRPWPLGREVWEQAESEIEIDPAWSEALDGLEDFSHIWVIWWLDRYDEPPTSTHVHPEGRQDMPPIGIFATRAPHRPNPVAITAVRLLERKGNRLRVEGLDATQGTFVVDIKPYLRRGDLIAGAVMPDWLERLWRIHDRERDAQASEGGG